VRAAFADILQASEIAHPRAKISGCLVAPMIKDGVETIVGVIHDPLFGPVIVFGLGGVFVEILQDVTFRAAPFDVVEAQRMIREIKAYPILEGVRGATRADIDALAAALAMLSVYAASNADTLMSIDMNPFLVLENGRGAIGVDALIVPRVIHDPA